MKSEKIQMTNTSKLVGKMGTKQMVTMAALIAMSYIGAQIKIQGSIAFDALPAFLAAIILSPVAGAIVGIFGHLVSALTSGFPMTLPVHLMIAAMMGVTCFAFGWVKSLSTSKLNTVLAVVVGFLLNGPVSLWITAYFMQIIGAEFAGMALFMVMIVPLSIAAFLNIIIAVSIAPAIRKAVGSFL